MECFHNTITVWHESQPPTGTSNKQVNHKNCTQLCVLEGVWGLFPTGSCSMHLLHKCLSSVPTASCSVRTKVVAPLDSSICWSDCSIPAMQRTPLCTHSAAIAHRPKSQTPHVWGWLRHISDARSKVQRRAAHTFTLCLVGWAVVCVLEDMMYTNISRRIAGKSTTAYIIE